MQNNHPVKLIKTDDGTFSIFSDEYNEAMHTVHGAYEESVVKFLEASKIMESENKIISILDIGFGMGYNILALLNEAEKNEKKPFYKIVSLEKEIYHELINQIKFDDNRDKLYDEIKIAAHSGFLKGSFFEINVILGDARNSLPDLINRNIKFDYIFHDAHSPSKNPELWTLDFFQKLYNLSNDNVVLTTYSSAAQVRNGLLLAGFIVGRTKSTGNKREGTAAYKTTSENCLTEEDILNLKSDPNCIPYRDFSGQTDRKIILEDRLLERKKFKQQNSIVSAQ